MQLEKIQQRSAVADLDLVEVLRDVDRSGKDFDARGRPAFEELMRRLEAGEAEAVVVYRMSRFGRDSYEPVRTVRRLRDRGAVFHSASERIVTISELAASASISGGGGPCRSRSPSR